MNWLPAVQRGFRKMLQQPLPLSLLLLLPLQQLQRLPQRPPSLKTNRIPHRPPQPHRCANRSSTMLSRPVSNPPCRIYLACGKPVEGCCSSSRATPAAPLPSLAISITGRPQPIGLNSTSMPASIRRLSSCPPDVTDIGSSLTDDGLLIRTMLARNITATVSRSASSKSKQAA